MIEFVASVLLIGPPIAAALIGWGKWRGYDWAEVSLFGIAAYAALSVAISLMIYTLRAEIR